MPIRDLLPGRRRVEEPSAALSHELTAPPAWMYPFPVGGQQAPLLHHELPSVHSTRAEMMEPVVRETLAEAGPQATAIDIACSEGWFSHRLLDWGAERVVGVDVRDVNIRRARLIQEHYGIPVDRLSFDVADALALTPEATGVFDVVLMVGLIYHLENPIGALRVARSLTRGACIVESQLTEQQAAITAGVGVTDQFEELEASWGSKVEPAQEDHPIASYGGVVSLVPNLAALMQAMQAVGFRDVRRLDASPGQNAQYVGGHRAMVVGYA